jgi:hypothetical protein
MPGVDYYAKGAAPSAAKDLLQGTSTTAATFQQGSSAHEAVSTPTLLNSWVNFGAPFENASYYKDPFGMVHCRGFVKSGTGVIFVLPTGYRPANKRVFATNGNNAFASISVDSSGNVSFDTGSNAFVSLDTLRFDVP